MKKDGNDLVFEQEDLNAALAFSIREHQFHNRNEMPGKLVLEVPACVTGKDRNEIPYAVVIEVVQVANNENTLPPAPEDKMPCPFERVRDYPDCYEDCPDTTVCPKAQPPLPTEEEIASYEETKRLDQGIAEPSPTTSFTEPESDVEGQEQVPSPPPETPLPKANKIPVTKTLDDYFCSECERMHVSGSKIHKSHLKHRK